MTNNFRDWAARHPAAAQELMALMTPIEPNNNGSSESRVQSELRLAAVGYGKLLRNNSGACVDDTGRMIRYGLGNDSAKLNKVYKSPDLIGPTRVTVQPHHVGRTFGVMTCVEVKESGWKKPKNDHERAQWNFLADMAKNGCIAGFATSVSDYERYVRDFII